MTLSDMLGAVILLLVIVGGLAVASYYERDFLVTMAGRNRPQDDD